MSQTHKDVRPKGYCTIGSGTVQGEVHINHLLYDILMIKAEALNDHKIFDYAEHLEKELMMIKNGEKVLEL